MPDQPLQPFAPPTALFNQLNISGVLSFDVVFQWIIYATFLFWFIYTIVAIYHWLKYSHASAVAFPAIVLHLFISLPLMIFALTGTRII